MAGYSGFSKSNNAVFAENNGMYPASTSAKKLGVKSGSVKALLSAKEWHHTSKYYNKTQYYELEEAIENIDALKSWRPLPKNQKTFENCEVSWVEWQGVGNYKRRVEYKVSGVIVIKKGDWYHFDHKVTEKYTKKMRKNGKTNGFTVIQAGRVIN